MTRARLALTSSLVVGALLSFSCKSEEQKRQEEAAKQFAEATKQMVAAGQAVGAAGAAIGAKAAAEGAAAANKAVAEGKAAAVEGAASGMKAAAEAMQNLAANMAGKPASAGAVATVDFRDLKALLPESIGAAVRKSASGEKSGAMGVTIAQAKASYKSPSGGELRVKLVDAGGAGPMAMSALGLAMVEIDKETDDGYEKTSTFDGRKSLEKYDHKRKRGELKVVAANRFIVEIDGHGVSMDEIKSAANALDLGKLEALAKK